MLIKDQLSLVEVEYSQKFYESHAKFLPKDLDSASIRRKSEFCAGRFCAFEASNEIGHKILSIQRGDKGEPLWPDEIKGSISHSHGIAVSMVGDSKVFQSIGIDIEKNITLKKIPTLNKMVLTDKDKLYFETLDKTYDLLFYQLCFTAKEALYKLIYPLVHEYFDFREASVESVNFKNNSLCLELHSQREKLKKFNGIYQAHYIQRENHLIAYFYLLTNEEY